jgi:hypothetical protein
MCQMAVKYPQWSQIVTTFFISRSHKIYPNWDFWYENIPSGNPCFATMTHGATFLSIFKVPLQSPLKGVFSPIINWQLYLTKYPFRRNVSDLKKIFEKVSSKDFYKQFFDNNNF